MAKRSILKLAKRRIQPLTIQDLANGKIRVPRNMKNGNNYRINIEDPGCFNTGHCPCIRYVYGVWLVGPELRVDDTMNELLTNKKAFSHRKHGQVVLLKTRASAVKAFKNLVAARANSVILQSKHIAELREQASRGDLKAAMELGIDYGSK